MNSTWNQKGVPHKGWNCIDVIDLNPDSLPREYVDYYECEMCCKTKIRFVHVMSHPDHEDDLSVGCVCAEKMSDDYRNPKQREGHLIRKSQRKKKWLSLKWRTSQKGNPYLKKDGMYMTVFRDKFKEGYWKFTIEGNYSKGKFPSQDEAKLALFEEYWKGLE